MVSLESKIFDYEKAGRKAVRNAHFYYVLGDDDRFHAYLGIYGHIRDKLFEFYRLKRELEKDETKLYPLMK
jgi:hypothetical protein